MGFVVLHIQKPKGNDARTTAHIERTVQPGNADPERKELNKEFITFPDEVENRTQAIQYRIENAGITRKIRENQVRALQVMLSGTPEDMQRIQNEGKIDGWAGIISNGYRILSEKTMSFPLSYIWTKRHLIFMQR